MLLDNDRGLTLIELCLTLLILGLLIAAMSPRLSNSYQEMQLKNTAEGIAEELQMIHEQTLFTGQQRRFKIWSDGTGFTIERQTKVISSTKLAEPVHEQWQVMKKQRLIDGLELRPFDVVLFWSVDGMYPLDSISLVTKQGRKYEIRFKNEQIDVRSTDDQNL